MLFFCYTSVHEGWHVILCLRAQGHEIQRKYNGLLYRILSSLPSPCSPSLGKPVEICSKDAALLAPDRAILFSNAKRISASTAESAFPPPGSSMNILLTILAKYLSVNHGNGVCIHLSGSHLPPSPLLLLSRFARNNHSWKQFRC